MEPLTVITVDDLHRIGACDSGIRDALQYLGDVPAAVNVASLLPRLTAEQRRWARIAAYLDGYGSGYGSGYGDGNGYGNGYGNGDGGCAS